jgi:hypothetical protein
MEQGTLTDERKACLRGQCFADDQPGTVLRDFEVLLDFLGRDGVVAGGGTTCFPSIALWSWIGS